MTPATSLPSADAAELADFLRFLGEWVAASQHQLSDSLANFMGDHPYTVETLSHDLARFRALLSADDNDSPSFLRPARDSSHARASPRTQPEDCITAPRARHLSRNQSPLNPTVNCPNTRMTDL
jgi:hypothetical protein